MQAIVFDFDGVLVDSEPLHFLAFTLVGKSLDPALAEHFTYERYLDEYIGFDDRDAFRHMLTQANQPIDDDRIAELCAKKQTAFDAVIASGQAAAIPGAVELVRECLVAELPIAIASGATRKDIDQLLASPALELTDAFPIIVTTDDVQRSKPNPETYRLAVERLNLDPADCLAIEDTAAGLASASAAGLQTLGLATTGPLDPLFPLADQLAEDLSKLKLADLQRLFP
ncbi:MAG: HAD family phosphatase [Planctomycetota bacterium]